MRIIVCGPCGFLGAAFLNAIPTARPCRADIANPGEVAAALDYHAPDVLINCAGKTGRPNIDWCENHKLETARANIAGPLVLLDQCLARNVLLVHVGSGCVFQGDNRGRGFSEQDLPNYRGSYYSRTKILADSALAEFPVLILRLRMPFDKKSHPRSLLNRLVSYRRVLDAQNSITYLPDFLVTARQLIERHETGIYHIVNPGTTSPYNIMERYRAIVDPDHEFERLGIGELAGVVGTGRSNCTLSTRKLESAGFHLQPVHQAVDAALRSLQGEGLKRTCENPSA